MVLPYGEFCFARWYLCIAKDSIYVAATPSDSDHAKRDTIICGHPVYLLEGAPDYSTHLWNTGDTTSSINVISSGVYWVMETTGCSLLTDTISINMRSLPVVSLGIDTFVCSGSALTIGSAQPPGTEDLWSTGSRDSSIAVTEGGTYWLAVTDSGCTTKDSIKIALLSPPIINLGPDTFICQGQQLVLLTNANALSYLWSDGSIGPTNAVSETGTYWVSVTNQCGSASDTINVTVDLCNIWFPSAFTPNGDGLNDIARVRGSLRDYRNFSLNIYNRFGERIFYTEDIYSGWDGTFNGVKQDLGTFFYMIYYTIEGKQYMIKGDLQLIR